MAQRHKVDSHSGKSVLEAVWKKLNDPQPDDPFETDIAQVGIFGHVSHLYALLTFSHHNRY